MWGPRLLGRLPATMIVPNLLWLGGSSDATDIEAIKKLGIKAVLNLRTTKLREVEGCQMYWHPLVDWFGNDQGEFDAAVQRLTELQAAKIPTLIHCHAGVSRSPTVLATWWAKEVGCSFDEACDVIRKMRPFIMPHTGLRNLARHHLGEIQDVSGGVAET
jgi:protein-tyrosine phosphatase